MIKLKNSGLNSHQLGFVLGVVIPILIFHIGLRCLRLFDPYQVKSRHYFIDGMVLFDLFVPPVVACSAIGFIAIVILGCGRRRLRNVSLLIAQLVALVFTTINTVGHQYFLAAGTDLSYTSYRVYLRDAFAMGGLIFSELTISRVLILTASSLPVLVIPWLVESRFRRPTDDSEFFSDLPFLNVGACTLAVLIGVWLLGANLQRNGHRYSSMPVVNLVLTSPIFSSTDKTRETEPAQYHALDAELELLNARKPKTPRNLAIIVLESTRARSVTPYQPYTPFEKTSDEAPELTPFLDILSKQSTLLVNARTIVPHTSKALVGILCGIEPSLRMPIIETRLDTLPAKCLAHLLKKQGYRTAFLQSATKNFENFESLIENLGFDTFIPLEKMSTRGFVRSNYFAYEDDIMLTPSRQWLQKKPEKPFLISYLTTAPHHQYLAPKTYGRHRFVKRDRLNRYLNAVHYLDHFLQNLIEQYKELGIYKETLFVIVGDHGEAFGEHGRRGHDNVIWEEGLRSPMLIHNPKTSRFSQHIKHPVSHLDILPTALAELGYTVKNANYPGANVFDLDHTRPMYAHCRDKRQCMSLISGDKKYIHFFGKRPDQFFDLSADPREKNNLADQKNLDKFREKLFHWRSRVNALYEQTYLKAK